MSSLHVDDQLFQQTLAVAAAQGKTIDEFVTETLRQAVGHGIPNSNVMRHSTRNGLPVMLVHKTAPAIDPRRVRDLIEEEGF